MLLIKSLLYQIIMYSKMFDEEMWTSNLLIIISFNDYLETGKRGKMLDSLTGTGNQRSAWPSLAKIPISGVTPLVILKSLK